MAQIGERNWRVVASYMQKMERLRKGWKLRGDVPRKTGRMKGEALMKKWKIAVFCCCIWLLLVAAASANSWGLRGELLDKVSDTNTWNDYTVVGTQAGDAAIMGSQYHNVLMRIEDGELVTYPTAVYQPGSEREDAVRFETKGDALILTYGKSTVTEQYVFSPCEYGVCLTGADIGEFHMELVDEDGWQRFKAVDATGEAYLRWTPKLGEFHIDLFPRTVKEVKHLNSMLAALDSGSLLFMGKGAYRSNIGKGTAPVYSAPYGEAAWRAGKGKAAVGLRGEFIVHHTLLGDDGEAYTCIQYDVSERTQRIGYVRSSDIGEKYSSVYQEQWIAVDVIAQCDTYLTDDPAISQYPQFTVPAGTQLRCMATYDDVYAYVGGEVKNGKFVDGGEIVWGFVPLNALDIDPDGNCARVAAPEAMARLEGAWRFYAGGNQAQDTLIFYPDGTYEGINPGRKDEDRIDTGTYAVTLYHPDSNLYWNNPPYELTLVNADGRVNMKGLSFDEDEGEEIFSLTNWEGSGGYQRIREDDAEGNG